MNNIYVLEDAINKMEKEIASLKKILEDLKECNKPIIDMTIVDESLYYKDGFTLDEEGNVQPYIAFKDSKDFIPVLESIDEIK